MQKIFIKNKQGIKTHGAEMKDPSEWISDCINKNLWGKPERWVAEKSEPNAEPYDDADVIDQQIIEVIPAILEIKDDANNVIQVGIPAITQKQVKLKAEYTIEIVDITEKLEQEQINQNSLKYLQDTDWYIIREIDSGIPCPIEIKEARAKARLAIIK